MGFFLLASLGCATVTYIQFKHGEPILGVFFLIMTLAFPWIGHVAQ